MAQATRPAAIEAGAVPPARPTRGYPDPFAARVAGRERRALGDAFGLTNFGVNLTRLPPGGMSALRHTHMREDEFIYIVEGEPVLVTNAGETPLASGHMRRVQGRLWRRPPLDKPQGPDIVYLEIGDRNPGDTVIYPDEDIGRALTP